MGGPPFNPAGSYRREVDLLEKAGVSSWEAVAALPSEEIRRIASSSPGSEARLIRLRGQARLVVGIDLSPAHAALLLHAGVADPAGLAMANPETLERQVGRLQRRLTGTAVPPPDLATLRGWILRTRARVGRSRN